MAGVNNSFFARPYKVYTALLTQTGTNAPIATVLENTLGQNVTWNYNGVGNWNSNNITGATQNNMFVLFNKRSLGKYVDAYEFNTGGASSVYLEQFDILLSSPANGLEKGYIEIRVYN